MDEELSKSFWVRIEGKAETGDVVVQLCFRPPDLEDWLA